MCLKLYETIWVPLLELIVRNIARHPQSATSTSIRYQTAIRYLVPWPQQRPSHPHIRCHQHTRPCRNPSSGRDAAPTGMARRARHGERLREARTPGHRSPEQPSPPRHRRCTSLETASGAAPSLRPPCAGGPGLWPNPGRPALYSCHGSPHLAPPDHQRPCACTPMGSGCASYSHQCPSSHQSSAEYRRPGARDPVSREAVPWGRGCRRRHHGPSGATDVAAVVRGKAGRGISGGRRQRPPAPRPRSRRSWGTPRPRTTPRTDIRSGRSSACDHREGSNPRRGPGG
jgi:hypothetical protein